MKILVIGGGGRELCACVETGARRRRGENMVRSGKRGDRGGNGGRGRDGCGRCRGIWLPLRKKTNPILTVVGPELAAGERIGGRVWRAELAGDWAGQEGRATGKAARSSRRSFLQRHNIPTGGVIWRARFGGGGAYGGAVRGGLAGG